MCQVEPFLQVDTLPVGTLDLMSKSMEIRLMLDILVELLRTRAVYFGANSLAFFLKILFSCAAPKNDNLAALIGQRCHGFDWSEGLHSHPSTGTHPHRI